MALDPLPLPERIEVEQDGHAGPFNFESWLVAAKRLLGSNTFLRRGEVDQNNCIIHSFDRIRSTRITDSSKTTVVSTSTNFNNLHTPVTWKDSSGPGIWAGVVGPYRAEKLAASRATSEATTLRRDALTPDFSYGCENPIKGIVSVSGVGENNSQTPYETVEEQRNVSFQTKHKKSLAKASWYLTITNELCGCRHGFAMINWCFQRLFIRGGVIYIEINPSEDALVTGRPCNANKLFNSDIFGFDRLPHCTRDFNAGTETAVDRDAAAALWNFVMLAAKDTVSFALDEDSDGSESDSDASESHWIDGEAQYTSANIILTSKKRFANRILRSTGKKVLRPEPQTQAHHRRDDDEEGPSKKRKLTATKTKATGANATKTKASGAKATGPKRKTSRVQSVSTRAQKSQQSAHHQARVLKGDLKVSESLADHVAREEASQSIARVLLHKWIAKHRRETRFSRKRDAHRSPTQKDCPGDTMLSPAMCKDESEYNQFSAACENLDQAIRPSDSYSQASEDGLTDIHYVAALQRMNIKFQLVSPSIMNAIYSNIAHDTENPFEGIRIPGSTV